MDLVRARVLAGVGLPLLFGSVLVLAVARSEPARAAGPERVPLAKEALFVDDGDSLVIHAKEGDETVRILGLDTPEVMHLEHDIPYDQPYGQEARGFLAGCLAVADKVEILRAAKKDPYGRTLAYVFINGRNYSVLALQAHLAVETVSHFGDNGFPEEAQACAAAAKAAGPVAFEDPHLYRARMREHSKWLKEHGLYPHTAAPAPR